MTWLLLATAGQFLNAIVAILDKYIVTDEKVLPRPFVYAFYSCLITGFWVIIYLFGFIPGTITKYSGRWNVVSCSVHVLYGPCVYV